MLQAFTKKKGFTLIELLVVIAVIGLLSTIVLVSMGGTRGKARDAQRMSDIRQISLAMEMCFGDASAACGGSDSRYPAVAVSSARVTSIGGINGIGAYLASLPQDPGGGNLACTSGTNGERSAGAYCGYASSAGSEYCIFTALSDNRWFAASEKGTLIMTSRPGSMSACP